MKENVFCKLPKLLKVESVYQLPSAISFVLFIIKIKILFFIVVLTLLNICLISYLSGLVQDIWLEFLMITFHLIIAGEIKFRIAKI